MSGIYGVVSWDGAPIDPAAVERMAQAAAHRAAGSLKTWRGAGANLLSLSHALLPDPAAEPDPVVDASADLAVVADLRLDNRSELVAPLAIETQAVSSAPTDAALLLAAYRRWGTEMAAQLVGDFAFAIYDCARRRVFAARDAMGMRPFYYRAEPTQFLFASEVAQLLVSPEVPVRLFEPAVAAHLVGAHGPLEWTFYDGVLQIPPGHALAADERGVRVWRYWDIDPARRIRYREREQYVEHFREIFVEAVRSRLRGVGRVGISLSGGMDSGSVAAATGFLSRFPRSHSAAIRVFCSAFDELTTCDERHVSDPLARHFGFSVTNVPADDAWPLHGYPDHGPHRDEPFIWVYQPLVERTLHAARDQGVAVMLTGDRGDEMVGDWVFDHLGLLRGLQFAELTRELQAHRKWTGLGTLALARQHLVRPVLDRLSRRDPSLTIRSARTRSLPPWVDPDLVRRVGLQDLIVEGLPRPPVSGFARSERYHRIFSPSGMRIARLNDRTHARFGIGWADPWSDRRLAEFVLAIPQWVVQRVGEPKAIARQAMKGIMPEEVRVAARKIEPAALFERGLKDQASETTWRLIRDSQGAKRGFIQEKALERAYQSYLSDEPPQHDFWWALTLEMWLRAYWP